MFRLLLNDFAFGFRPDSFAFWGEMIRIFLIKCVPEVPVAGWVSVGDAHCIPVLENMEIDPLTISDYFTIR